MGNFNSQDAQVAMQRLLNGECLSMQFLPVMMTPLQALSLYYFRQVSVCPRMIALAGFDNSPLANYLTPPLTTINAHIQQAGYTAA